MQVPCVTIAAPQGKSGKTLVSLGLCAALRQHGLIVQPFKKGPDYIDPSWLSAAAGRKCRNLDTILMPETAVLASFDRGCLGADVAVVEGAMGLYDGFDDQGNASTARTARLLGSPVVLVVDATRMTRSIAALVSGYQHFEADTNVAGVVINNVSGSRHRRKLIDAVENYCGIPVVGCISRDPEVTISQRHLGLVPFSESQATAPLIEHISQSVQPGLDLDAILSIARTARASTTCGASESVEGPATVKVGIMQDRVFSFYYPENLEALRQAGAELVFIDSTQDHILPEIDALYIGGGFPELFLKELEANIRLRQDIAAAIHHNLPVYAECAGLMYLCRGIHWQGDRHEMVGVIPADIELTTRPQGHGYVTAEVVADNPLFPVGMTLWGHEFHHSRLLKADNLKFAYRLSRGQGVGGHADGIVYKNVFATYTHIHALGVPKWADALVSLAKNNSARSLSVRAA